MQSKGDDVRHIPVLHTAVRDLLRPGPGETVIDCTLGLGGHASMFAEAIGPTGKYIGIDADQDNLAIAKKRLAPWSDHVTLLHGNFRDLAALKLPSADILFADLGLSSPHIDDAERGFSFRFDGPLDLRFDRTRGEPASAMIEAIDEGELMTVLRSYGELEHVKKLGEAMKRALPKTTQELRAIAEDVFGWQTKRLLPQIFQALRIWVNGELDALTALLHDGPALLKPGGRFAVISYHSLEDRPVKQTFRALTTPERDAVTGAVSQDAPYRMLTRKAIRPEPSEIAENPRARSAIMRAIART